MVRAAFRDVAPGDYDLAAVLRAVDRLYETGLVDGVWPRAEAVGRPGSARAVALAGTDRAGEAGGEAAAGRARLVVRADARPPNMLLGAVAYDTDRGGRAWATLQQRLPFRRPLEMALTGSVRGRERRVVVGARLPSLRWLPLAWSAGLHHQRSEERIFETPPDADDAGRDAGIDRVERVGGWVGGEVLRIAADRFLTAMLVAEEVDQERGPSGTAAGPLLRVGRMEPLNRIVGGATELELEMRRRDIAYGRARVRASVGVRRDALAAAVVADLTAMAGDAPTDVLPSLGHEYLVPGMRWGEERGRTRLVVGGDLARPGPANSDIRLRLRAGAASSHAADLDDVSAWAGGAQLAIIWSTPAGPVLAGIAASTRGARRVDLRLGPIF